MPISNETIVEANRKMLGKTNRAILFAKVNMDPVLDPDVPEEEQEATPSLGDMLARVNEMSNEQFLSGVRENLTVTSFKEFLEKFQPGFYYRVSAAAGPAPAPAEATEATDTFDAGGDGDADAADSVPPPSAGEDTDEPPPVEGAKLEFSLEGGFGWKKVRITSEHPYIACLSKLIRQRVRQDVSTFRVDVDASMFTFKPKNQRALMRKLAEDVQVKSDRLMLEAKRNPASKDTARALEAYKGAADEFQGALEDSVRVLPTIVYGLEQTAKELKRLSPGGGPVDNNVYQIEFGKNRAMIASPRKLPPLAAATAGPKALAPSLVQVDGRWTLAAAAAAKDPKALGEAAKTPSALAAGASAEDTALVKTEDKPKATELAIRPIEAALDIIRQEGVAQASKDIALIPQEKRFPVVVGKFMDQMINRGLIQPLLGNMVAVVLQNPKELAMLSPDIKDVEVFHDMFLGVYSNAVEDFLKTVTPLFETIMGVYLLFNEFPTDVKLSDSMKPELVIANADLPDLMLTREDELKSYFDMACAQATNQFRDAISFVIVPNVAEFKKKRPKKKKADNSIMMDDPLLAAIQAAQAAAAGGDEGGYGRVTFVDEMMVMMDWGLQYGFQVLFSPEERVRADRAQRDFYANLSTAYAVETVVENDAGECAILCVPDFIIMPPDGKLVTGKTADGEVEVGVDVPELNVRSCFVACGRLMANDVPGYLQRKLLKAKKDPTSVRMDVPGIGVDLGMNGFLGETDLPTDHFLNDGIMGDLLNPEMPFAVFTHVSGRSPFLSVPRTMRRLTGADGNPFYRSLHLFRQQIYLNRLLRAAHELGYAGPFPSDNAEAELMIGGFIEYILKWSGWYNPKMVNSFPSKLNETKPYTVSRQEGNYFKIAFGFEQGLISEFGIRF